MAFLLHTAIGALFLAGRALAHGHVVEIIVNGVSYRVYDSTSDPYNANPPKVAGWAINQPDNGFIEPNAFAGPDLACHKAARPGAGHISVRTGDHIALRWDAWPASHKGPVLDYLAACPTAGCEAADAAQLRFFKIAGAAHLDGANPGTWAADVLVRNGLVWTVRVPDVPPGPYVLRHEILALHAAGQPNGAQAYPQCVNLHIAGGGAGAALPVGVSGTALYRADDPGILFNLYTSPIRYPEPGPTRIAGVPASVPQGTTRATATSSATLPGVGGGGSGGGVTTTMRPTTTGQGGAGGQTLYGQCGGSGWTGPSYCAQGHCTTANPFYAQCVP